MTLPREKLSDDALSSELKKNLEDLKESARIIHEAVSASEPAQHRWGSNPLFEEKLKVHKQLNSLVKQQQDLADGIVALIKSVHDFEHERLRRQKPRLPPAPRPTVTGLPPLSGAGQLPSMPGDPSFRSPPKKRPLFDLSGLFGFLKKR